MAQPELQELDRQHLGPVFCALVAAAAFLLAVQAYVGARLPSRLPFYAAHAMSFKVNGNVLQTVAFRARSELPIYGSSELDRWADNRADAFFREKPTGFAVFPVGRGGATCLMIQQKLAAVGNAARGKSVVIFLSPSWFLQPSVTESAVAANLGIPQLSAWVFGDNLSLALKADIARRLQDFPGTLKNQLLIADALQCLADPTPLHQFYFALLYPLGRLQNAILERLDYGVIFWEMIFPQKRWLREYKHDQNGTSVLREHIDWDQLIAQAEADGQKHENDSGSTTEADASGIADHNQQASQARPGHHDQDFISQLNASREFDDLELMTRVLTELKMRALFINQPFNGISSDQAGITPQARRVYYERLQMLLRIAGYPLRDFSEHEEDRLFFNDIDHPSAKAWIYYDRVIDQFYSNFHG